MAAKRAELPAPIYGIMDGLGKGANALGTVVNAGTAYIGPKLKSIGRESVALVDTVFARNYRGPRRNRSTLLEQRVAVEEVDIAERSLVYAAYTFQQERPGVSFFSEDAPAEDTTPNSSPSQEAIRGFSDLDLIKFERRFRKSEQHELAKVMKVGDDYLTVREAVYRRPDEDRMPAGKSVEVLMSAPSEGREIIHQDDGTTKFEELWRLSTNAHEARGELLRRLHEVDASGKTKLDVLREKFTEAVGDPKEIEARLQAEANDIRDEFLLENAAMRKAGDFDRSITTRKALIGALVYVAIGYGVPLGASLLRVPSDFVNAALVFLGTTLPDAVRNIPIPELPGLLNPVGHFVKDVFLPNLPGFVGGISAGLAGIRYGIKRAADTAQMQLLDAKNALFGAKNTDTANN